MVFLLLAISITTSVLGLPSRPIDTNAEQLPDISNSETPFHPGPQVDVPPVSENDVPKPSGDLISAQNKIQFSGARSSSISELASLYSGEEVRPKVGKIKICRFLLDPYCCTGQYMADGLLAGCTPCKLSLINPWFITKDCNCTDDQYNPTCQVGLMGKQDNLYCCSTPVAKLFYWVSGNIATISYEAFWLICSWEVRTGKISQIASKQTRYEGTYVVEDMSSQLMAMFPTYVLSSWLTKRLHLWSILMLLLARKAV